MKGDLFDTCICIFINNNYNFRIINLFMYIKNTYLRDDTIGRQKYIYFKYYIILLFKEGG